MMEKYGVENDDLLSDLRDEEHQLMADISHYMSGHKTADSEQRFHRAQGRLQSIRDKITAIDLGKKRQD